MGDYDKQDRGDGGAYDRYLREMDASMRQKVALTAAHLLCEGDVADMGMGSGSGSYALAALYPELSVVGVDVNPAMVERAAARYRLPNLRFVQGDVAAPCFEPGSVEAILDSSVLHHVTSFNGYDRSAAARAIAVQVEQLAHHGVVILRDFLDPGPGMVWLDVLHRDGHDDAADPLGCSTATLLERFAREFRSLLPEAERGLPLARVEPTASCPLEAGFSRYALAHTHAVEFVLRKDYRESWDVEVQEEYTFGTQAELEAAFATLGLRVLASTPLRNPWIVEHRFRGQVKLWSQRGEALDFPATNYVLVGQKVRDGDGVRIREVERAAPIGYLELSQHEHRESGEVFDLARRPGVTIDVIPWFERGDTMFVLARRNFPRPVLGCARDDWRPLDGATPSTYVTEPLVALRTDRPVGETVDASLRGFPGLEVRGFDPGHRYFPSPGGILEQVEPVFLAIAPTNVQEELRGVSGFSTAGTLRAIESRQLLRAAQVGALPDARLELNVYELLHRRGRDPGAWIGEAITLGEGKAPAVTTMAELLVRPHRRAFRSGGVSSGFLEVRSAVFVEESATGEALHREAREYVVPTVLSRNTIAVAVLRRHEGRIYLGVDDDDLPAAQCFDGNSELLVAPAWRLPRDVVGREASRAWVCARLEASYGLTLGGVWDLGGPFFPSPGLTPEVVYPLAVACAADAPATDRLSWVELEDVLAERAHLADGHLSVVLWRAAHACGLLSDQR